MNLHDLTKNRYLKIIVAVLFLFLIVFKDNDKKNNIFDSFSLKELSETVIDTKDKVKEIKDNIDKIKEIQNQQNIVNKLSSIIFEEINQGLVGDSISCLDQVKVIYKYFDPSTQKVLDFGENLEINIGEKYQDSLRILIEKVIKGKKIGSILRAELIGNYQDGDQKLNDLLKLNNHKLMLEIYILSISKSNLVQQNNNSNCSNVQ